MKHNLIFFTYILITIFPSHCMESIQQAKILREITVAQALIRAQYIAKNRVIAVGANGCSIINPITNQEIIKINNEQNQYYFDLSLDKKEVALVQEKTIKIYNTETGEQIWIKKEEYDIEEVTFSPREKILFSRSNNRYQIFSIIKEHDYITDKTTNSNFGERVWPNITLHPKKNILCAGLTTDTFLYNVENMIAPFKRKSLKSFTLHNCQYSHDGSFIVARGFNSTHKVHEIRIMDEQASNLFSFLAKDKCKNFDTTKLNSDSTILAVLVKNKDLNTFYSIEYYDIPKKKCIYSKSIINKSVNCFSYPNFAFSRLCFSFNDLSFSPNDTQLMITVNGKCFITLTPFGIKQAAFIYWILKNYQTNNPEIPADVIQYIVNSYIEIL